MAMAISGSKPLEPNSVFGSKLCVWFLKKRGESVGWLPEEGKDGIKTSLLLPEQPDCTCIHMHSHAEVREG